MGTTLPYRVRIADWDADRSALRSVRETVFVREQGVPLALEWDEFDAVSRHVLAETAEGAVGTGRLLPDGHIGRMAVLAGWRGQGVGSTMFRALLDLAADAGHRRVMLSAQSGVQDFYRRFGFETEGPSYLEAGIEHVAMARDLRKPPPSR